MTSPIDQNLVPAPVDHVPPPPPPPGGLGPLRPGDVLAAGLDNGRCPVGMVKNVDQLYIRLDLYSWLLGTFTAGIAVIRHEQVREFSLLAVQDEDGVYDMEPIRQYQIAWEASR